MSRGYSYKLIVSYIGTNFFGWQSQTSGRSIQDELQAVLKTVLRAETTVRGASRTDSGVHAEGQVCVITSDKPLDIGPVLRSLNALLPDEIAVLKLDQVDSSFHPIIDCLAKTYRYRLWRGREISPFVKPFCWSVHQDIDVEIMRENLNQICGCFDFSSFCASDSDARSKIRTILDARIEVSGSLVDIWILGEGFLKQMVRTIVGSIVELGLKKATHRDILAMLEAKNRSQAGPTAPAAGLTLVEIYYDSVPELDDVILQARRHGYAIKTL